MSVGEERACFTSDHITRICNDVFIYLVITRLASGRYGFLLTSPAYRMHREPFWWVIALTYDATEWNFSFEITVAHNDKFKYKTTYSPTLNWRPLSFGLTLSDTSNITGSDLNDVK